MTPAVLAQGWAATWPKEAPLAELLGADGALTFDFMGGLGFVGYMPTPVPWSDFEGPATCAWHWPDAVGVLRAHEAHLVVGVSAEGEAPKARAIRLTLLTTAVCASMPSATAVYWGSGTTVSPADRFVELAKEMSPEALPLLSWVEFRTFPGSVRGTCNVFTTGLEALGLMEIEVRDAPHPPARVLERVMDVAAYLLESGPVLKDGDTIGTSATERLRIHHAPSQWDRDQTVLWIEL